MKDILTIRFSGPQGKGVQLATKLSGIIYASSGFNIFAINDFESRIVGGYSFGQLSISTHEINSINEKPDIIFSFSKDSLERDIKDGREKSTIIFGNEAHIKNDNIYSFTLEKDKIKFLNIFCLGILCQITDIALDTTCKHMTDYFKTANKESFIENNLEIFKKGYQFASGLNIKKFDLKKNNTLKKKPLLLSGSQSIAMGAASSGVKFYSGYPMSPSTGIMTDIANYSKEYNIFVEQAEDEISAANMVIGATYAGVRAMTSTSGGGLSLMAETVSLSAMSENPLVIAVGQRPGPATGFPTRTAQGDLKMVLSIGHGEFSRAILAPGTHEKAFHAAQKAQYLSEKYQIPVFILTDQLLIDSLKTSSSFNIEEKFQERFINTTSSAPSPSQCKRYEFNTYPFSPRSIPGLTNDLVFSDSNMHDKFGLITEDKLIGENLIKKLVEKEKYIKKEMEEPECFGPEDADLYLIGWGSTYGVLRDSTMILSNQGYKIRHVHFHEIYPLEKDSVIDKFSKSKNAIVVENSASSQLEWILRAEYGITLSDRILKFNGRPFYLDELINRIKGSIDKC